MLRPFSATCSRFQGEEIYKATSEEVWALSDLLGADSMLVLLGSGMGIALGGGYHGRTQHDARPNGRSYKPAVADQSETSPKQASLHITWCTFDMDSLIAQQGPQISCSALWVDHAIISRRRQASGLDKFHAVLIITGVNSCWIRRFLSPADSPSREPRCKPFAILYAV
jgi:hypothetical protein